MISRTRTITTTMIAQLVGIQCYNHGNDNNIRDNNDNGNIMVISVIMMVSIIKFIMMI